MLLNQKQQIIETIHASLVELKQKHRVKSIFLLGSVARGEEKLESDIDLFVDLEDGADLFDLIAIGNTLEEKLKRKIDIVSRKALRKEMKDLIEREAVRI